MGRGLDRCCILSQQMVQLEGKKGKRGEKETERQRERDINIEQKMRMRNRARESRRRDGRGFTKLERQRKKKKYGEKHVARKVTQMCVHTHITHTLGSRSRTS